MAVNDRPNERMAVFARHPLSQNLLPRCILVDANFLIAHVDQKTSDDDRARIQQFFAAVEKEKSKIIIPMPAVAEFLVRCNTAAINMLNLLEKKSYIYLAPFDRMAAFECALLDRAALGAGDKKDDSLEPWQKIKIDRQIVAIGKANGAGLVISADKSVRDNALRVGMLAITVDELGLAPRQLDLIAKPSK